MPAVIRYECNELGYATYYVDCTECTAERDIWHGRVYLTFFQGEGASLDARRYVARHNYVVHGDRA